MTISWLDALLFPANQLVIDGTAHGGAVRAVSLLIEGRLQEYDNECESAGLPSTESVAEIEGDDPVRSLASGLVMLRRGRPDGLSAIQGVAAHPLASPDLRLCAAILRSVALADAGRPDLALAALRENKADARTDQEKAAWNTHVSLRLADEGDFIHALAFTRTALRLSSRRRDPSSITLHVVASRNEAELAFAAEGRFVAKVPSTSTSPAVASIAIGAGEGATQYLDDHFQAFFEDPYARSWTFRQQDQVDDSLVQALLRSEVLGSRSSTRRLQKSLGEYRLLSQAGAGGTGAAGGFILLRRAGDAPALKRALRVFRAAGPIEVLRMVGEASVRGSWLVPEMGANLELLAGSAFAFGRKTSALAFDRLTSALPDLVDSRMAGAWLASSAFDALAGLLAVVDTQRANTASALLRQFAERPPDAMLHQSMQSAINQLPWADLAKSERESWGQYVQSFLRATDDHIFPARIAAQALISTGDRRASRLAADAFRQTHSLWLAPILINNKHLTPADRRNLIDEILASALNLRTRAMAGHYSMGGLSIGALLGQSASRFKDQRVKRELALFALEPKVPVDERVLSVLPLLDSPESVPKWLGQRLAEGLPQPADVLPLFGGSSKLDATNLRLRGRFGRLRVNEAVSGIIALANSSDVETRVNAARTIVELNQTLRPDVTATLLLSLSHDTVPLVRGWAGQALGSLVFTEGVLEAARIARLIELVQEPGEVVPALTWHGIAEGGRANQIIDPKLARNATVAADRHIAVTVRNAAKRVVAMVAA